MIVRRPIWRRFRPPFFDRAVQHVRAGGHAVIVPKDDAPMTILLPVTAEGKITELGEWAMLSIDHRRWRRLKDGRAKGLLEVRVRTRYEGSVLDWCERDSVHPGPMRDIELDCLACGACCHDSHVILSEEDLARFREAGREELTSDAYTVEREGRVTLRFLGPACQHLGGDNACAIYPIRPGACRAFVAGSEACLAAREQTLKLRDE